MERWKDGKMNMGADGCCGIGFLLHLSIYLSIQDEGLFRFDMRGLGGGGVSGRFETVRFYFLSFFLSFLLSYFLYRRIWILI